MARVNLCPNPSLKNNATDFFGGGARVTGIPDMLRETGYRSAGATVTAPRGTVVAGRTYRFSAYVRGTGGASSGNANINWYAGGTYLSSAPGVAWTVWAGNIVRVESGARVAPATATQGLLNITGIDNPVDVTAYLYEETDQLGEFFDGDSSGCSWNGTDGNSTSTNPVGDSPQPDPDPVPPTGDEAAITQGWGTPLFEEHFNAPLDLDEWGLYDGPGHGGNGTRDPERVNVVNGILRLNGTSGGSTGGMAMRIHRRRYGRWEVRMRAYRTGGTTSQEQYHPVLIVWPTGDNWPQDGEYDFVENDIGDTSLGAFLHYPHDPGPVQQIGVSKSGVNIADWHNYAFEWQPSGLRGYVDGVQWFGPLSGGATSTRKNIQDMPLGHLTIQLDNFGGSPHAPANMDIEWVKVYSHTSTVTNKTISSVGGFDSVNQTFPFGIPTVGNRFRMYLSNTAADITAPNHPTFEQTTNTVRRKLDLTRTGSSATVSDTEVSPNLGHDVLLGSFVSPPMTSSGMLQGPFTVNTAVSASPAEGNLRTAISLSVVSNDGSVTRGAYRSVAGNQNNQATATGRGFIIDAGTPIACQVGDRLVLDVGVDCDNTTTTPYTATLRYGGTAADLEHNDDATVALTAAPNVTFTDAAVERLFRGRQLLGASINTAEQFGTPGVSLPPSQTITLASGIASVESVATPTVTAEAYPILVEGFGGEEFGTLSVGNTLAPMGIESGEVVPEPIRVRRDRDLFTEGIASPAELGATALLYNQWLDVVGIESGEEFGGWDVEDPNRVLRIGNVQSAEQFGFPVLGARVRTMSILSGEAFGGKRGPATIRRGVWKLVNPTRVEKWRLGEPRNVIYVRNVVAQTVLLINGVLHTIENPTSEQIIAADEVWLGGHDNITESQAIRDLWVANGYDVEMSFR